MKKSILFSLSIFCLSLGAMAQKNLKLHYDFSDVSVSKVIKDKSGNGFDGTLKNSAELDKVGNCNVLNLGFSNGYVDMGAKVGNLIGALSDFTVSTYIYIDGSTNLSDYGNFIWTFSNSDNMQRDVNGCMFFSAKTEGYSISKTDNNGEHTLAKARHMKTLEWMHVAYVQEGSKGRVFVNGKLTQEGEISLLPKELGKTAFNYIGRSPYRDDRYLKALLSDFRIYDKALTEKELQSLSSEVSKLNEAHVDYAKKPIKFISNGNPIFTHKYTADPAALVHNDTFYLYTGQDTGDGRGYNIPNWLVFSTQDMKTWYEHPIPLKTGDFKWAKGNSSWASQVIERNGKFYWYVSTEQNHGGKGIGVAVSDSPTGPFVDARGSALITNDMTTECTRISWDDIDPTVWIDDDGQAYLFWGNTCCYYAKLKENMIELDSEIMTVDIPYFTEAPWIHKRGDLYYLSYAAWFPEKICYAMSKSIHGPWEYKGVLNEVAGNSNTNHQALLEFKGKWYFVYHNGSIPTQGGSYLRSVCIDYLHYNQDGSLKRIQMTSEGVDQVK